ncbi:uncharacterized protein LOC129946535 [Eupeodes corollae]|uniref:uncharacterized protein LOC129946535 n=1 Tax=Eupeodes corollae TaxID=290404 RepID=UPI00248FECC1|nr:uncharacterized protein LOC129946535 [Eupeodes corollae]
MPKAFKCKTLISHINNIKFSKMGCAGSTPMVPATSDISLKPALAPASDSLPKPELILKDLPDVVEKVIESIKEPELKNLKDISIENTNLSDLKDETVSAVKSDVKSFLDINNKNLTQAVTQGILTDSISSSATKRPPEMDNLEQHNKSKNKDSPTISSDVDSLRTSSPESEIEEALANNNDQNPPTPKPTFSELQNLVVGPVNSLVKNYVVKTTTDTFVSQAGEKNPANDNSGNGK